MRPRRTDLAGALLGLLTVAAAAVLWWAMATPYPCMATFEQVQVGMTQAEVEATVGGPPGDYISGGIRSWSAGRFLKPRGEPRWHADDADLHVRFDDDG